MSKLSERTVEQLKTGRVLRSQILKDIGTSTGAKQAILAAARQRQLVVEWWNKGMRGRVSYRLRPPRVGESVGDLFTRFD